MEDGVKQARSAAHRHVPNADELRCRGCGYDLRGDVSQLCPECGGRIVGRGSDPERLLDPYRPPIQVTRCETCGYDLRGNRSGVCPECGAPALRASPMSSDWRVLVVICAAFAALLALMLVIGSCLEALVLYPFG